MPVVSIPKIPEIKSLGNSSSSHCGSSSAFSFDADRTSSEMFIRKDSSLPSLPTPPSTATEDGLAKKPTNRLSTIFRAYRNNAAKKAVQLNYKSKKEAAKFDSAIFKNFKLIKPFPRANPMFDIGVLGDSVYPSLKDRSVYSHEDFDQFAPSLLSCFQAGPLEDGLMNRFFQSESPDLLSAEAEAVHIPAELISIYHSANEFLSERAAKPTKRGIPSCYRAYYFTRTIGSSIEEYLNDASDPPIEFGPAEFMQECEADNWPSAFDSTSSMEDLGSYHESLSLAATETSSADDEGLDYPASMASKISRIDTESQSGCGTLGSRASCDSEKSRENHNEVFFSVPASPIFAADSNCVPKRAPEPISLNSSRVYENARADIQARLVSAGVFVCDAANVPEHLASAATRPSQPTAIAQKAISCDTKDRSLGAGVPFSVSENDTSVFRNEYGPSEMHGFLAEHYTSEMFAYVDSEYLA